MSTSNKLESDSEVLELRSAVDQLSTSQQRSASRAKLAIGLFAATSTAVVLLSDLGPFHRYWRFGGLPVLIAWLASLLFGTFAVGIWWSAWSTKREAKRDLQELLRDRYDAET